MEGGVQSENLTGREARCLRSAESEVGRKCVRTKFGDRGRRERRITSPDIGKEIEQEWGVVARREMDRVSFRPPRPNQRHARRQETAVCDFGGWGRGAAVDQDGKRHWGLRMGAGFAANRLCGA